MRVAQRCLALVLSLFLLLAQSAVGLAEDTGVQSISDAFASGREVSFRAKADWAGLPLLDEETNSLLASLLGAMEFTGSYGAAQDGSTSYVNFDLLMQGQSALPFQMVTDTAGVYYVSPIYAGPLAVEVEKLPVIFHNFGAFLEAQMPDAEGSVVEMFDMYGAMMGSLQAGEMPEMPLLDGADEILAALDIEPILAALDSWSQTALTAEPYEGEIISVLGVETGTANVYEITKEELVALANELVPLLKGNTAFWEALLQSDLTGATVKEAEADLDDMIAEVQAELEQLPANMESNMPDGLVMRYLECLDVTGKHTLSEVEFYIPAASEEEEDFTLYLEWLEDGTSFYLYGAENGDGFSLLLMEEPTETASQDGQTVTDDYFGGALSVYEDDEITTEILLSVAKQLTEKQGERVNDWMFTVSLSDGLEEYGLEIASTNTTTYDGQDAASETTIDVSLLAGEETMPILTIAAEAVSGEPKGPAFDVEAMQGDFIRLGNMTEEEFITWMTVDETNAIMQLAMRIMSLLPQDIASLLMGTPTEVPQN